MSEKVAWIREVEGLLTIRQQQQAEFNRFCKRFGITQFRLGDGSKLTPEQALQCLLDDRYYVQTNLGELHATPTANKPFITLWQNVKIANRTLQIYNGLPRGNPMEDKDNPSAFSDESMEIASAIAKVFKGLIQIYRTYYQGEPDSDNLIVLLPDGDYFAVAYNRLYGDC